MAEALGIAAGIVGVVVPALHGTRLLIDDVKKISDAPETIQSLQADLTSTVLALESLKTIEESEWQTLGPGIAEQSKDAVKTCGSACETFRNDLQRWTRRSAKGGLSWRDRANVGFFKQRQIKSMSEHLQSCKVTCSSVAGMGTLYAALRTGHMTEELKKIIAASQIEVSSVAKQTDSQIADVQASLDELSLKDAADLNANEEDDRIGVEAQLSEQRAALESSQKLFLELKSKLQQEELEKVTAAKGATTNVSFGSITSGFGVGVSNAPISNITFGQSQPPSTK